MRSHDRKCLKLFDEEGFTYSQIAEKLDLTYDEVKHALKRARLAEGRTSPFGERKFDLDTAVLKFLKRGTCREELSDCFNLSEEKVESVINDFIDNGFVIDDIDGMLQLGKNPVPEDKLYVHESLSWMGNVTRFGVVSDTHLSSKYAKLKHLNRFYDIIKDEGIDTVYNAGDILDGHNVYHGHIYELNVLGSDAQVEHAVNGYPYREGVKTRFITGNHDLSFFKSGGRDVGKSIDAERDDMEYLGQLGAYVGIGDKSMYLIHPDGGSPYQISYRAQILARGFTEDSKPDIMVVGHLHQLGYFIDRGIHILLGASFQSQTPYGKRKGLLPQIGGWIVEVGMNEDKITSFNPTFVPFQ